MEIIVPSLLCSLLLECKSATSSVRTPSVWSPANQTTEKIKLFIAVGAVLLNVIMPLMNRFNFSLFQLLSVLLVNASLFSSDKFTGPNAQTAYLRRANKLQSSAVISGMSFGNTSVLHRNIVSLTFWIDDFVHLNSQPLTLTMATHHKFPSKILAHAVGAVRTVNCKALCNYIIIRHLCMCQFSHLFQLYRLLRLVWVTLTTIVGSFAFRENPHRLIMTEYPILEFSIRV